MRDRAERQRRQARWVGAAGFLLAVGLPVALWYPATQVVQIHDVVTRR